MSGGIMAYDTRQPIRAKWDGSGAEIDVMIDNHSLPVVPKTGGFAVTGFTCHQVTRLRDGSKPDEPKWVPRSGERLVGYESSEGRVVARDWGIHAPAPGDIVMALHMGALVYVCVEGPVDATPIFADMTGTPLLVGFKGFVTQALVPDYCGQPHQAVVGTMYGSFRPKRLAQELIAGYLVR